METEKVIRYSTSRVDKTLTHPEARQCTCTSLSPKLLQYENMPDGSQATLG